MFPRATAKSVSSEFPTTDYHPDGAGESASRAESRGADESHGRWLDGRRLVPQWRFREQGMNYIYEQEATRGNEEKVVDQSFRRLRRFHGVGLGGRTGTPPRPRSSRILAQAFGSSQLRCVVAGAGDGSHSRGAAAESADHAGREPVDQEDIYGAPRCTKR